MTDPTPSPPTRRDFLLTATLTGTGLLLAGCESTPAAKHEAADDNDEKVTPGEDLMQEHGILKRILLVYQESIRRLDSNEDLPPDTVKQSAQLVRSFVEDYHEQNEERYLFPRFQKSHKLTDLVDTLLTQHQAGRRTTDRIITLSTLQSLKNPDDRRELASRLRDFIRMYEVHEAREDTVLFPAFRDMLTKNEYDALGETFEKEEHQHFGADGFDMAVDKIASLEKTLNIYDLAQFTPHS